MQINTLPHSLKKGETIGIISSARKISLDEIEPAIKIIEAYGYKVQLGKNLLEEDYQFAGTDQQRAADLQEMFLNPKVKAVLFARGGYGTVRLLPYLDSKIFKTNPKWIIGYSDITVLHSYFQTTIQIQSLHASMPINFSAYQKDDMSISSLFDVLEGKPLTYSIPSDRMNRNGKAEGVLVGGNLSILYSLRGTSIDIDTNHKILFIEDLDEYLYHIDRIMMNLKIGGKLDDLKALIVGGMNDMNDNTIPFGKTAKEIILEAVSQYNYPVLFDFPAGHILNNYALPMGRKIQINVAPKNSSISFE